MEKQFTTRLRTWYADKTYKCCHQTIHMIVSWAIGIVIRIYQSISGT